jgi:anti-sigma factor RsiW
VTIATEHLQPGQIDAFADHELPPDQARAVQQHIAACHPCSLRLLSTIELKRATVEAGSRLDPSAAMLARLTAQLQQSAAKAQPNRLLSFPRARFLWPAVAAAFLIFAVSLSIWSVRRSRNALSAELPTELLDQHLATLSTAAPQVLSTDRHTVKPWFEGKLPFSFNLPEANALPPGTILKGADLTWLRDHPAALLLFTAGKHQVSVFVMQSSFGPAPAASIRSGFALRSTTADDLRFIAVGDIDPPQLDRLLAALASVQQAR